MAMAQIFGELKIGKNKLFGSVKMSNGDEM